MNTSRSFSSVGQKRSRRAGLFRVLSNFNDRGGCVRAFPSRESGFFNFPDFFKGPSVRNSIKSTQTGQIVRSRVVSMIQPNPCARPFFIHPLPHSDPITSQEG